MGGTTGQVDSKGGGREKRRPNRGSTTRVRKPEERNEKGASTNKSGLCGKRGVKTKVRRTKNGRLAEEEKGTANE